MAIRHQDRIHFGRNGKKMSSIGKFCHEPNSKIDYSNLASAINLQLPVAIEGGDNDTNNTSRNDQGSV